MFGFRVCFVLFVISQSAFADLMYGKLGGSVDLDPGKKSGPITSVTWKHKADLALEWFGEDVTCYRTFAGRCELNKITGSFTIRNLTLEDSGEYTSEVNNMIGGKTELKLIKPVPKPRVFINCNSEKTACNLTCKANINDEFGSVTYKWKTVEREMSTNKELSLTEKNEEISFFCELTNPVSKSASDEISNPISRGINYAVVIVAVIVSVVLVILGLVIGTVFRNRAGYFPCLDKIYPCNETARRSKRDAAQVADDNSTIVQITERQNQDAPGEATQLLNLEMETKSEGKAALNGYQAVNVDKDVLIEQQQNQPAEQVSDDEGESELKSKSEETQPPAEEPEKPNDSTCDPFADTQPEPESSQESYLDPSAVSSEPSSQTVSTEQQHNQPAEQVSDNEESELKSKSEETQPAAEEPEKPNDSTCDPPVDTQPEPESSMESYLDPSVVSSEPSCQTETLSTEALGSEETPEADSTES